MNIRATLNEVLVKLFREIITIEERAIRQSQFKDLTANDMHVIEAIGTGEARSMSTVAKSLSITTGTLTISVNGLVKKGYVERVRSEEDRRVVLVSLSAKGKQAYAQHADFHNDMIDAIAESLNEEELKVLGKALTNLHGYFMNIKNGK